MKWHNAGSAPCYRPYRIAYQLTNAQGYRRVFVSPVTVNHWMPGSIELFTREFFEEPKDLPPGEINTVSDTIQLPADIAPGDYNLSLGVVGEQSEDPVIRLGIAGRDAQGWYPVGKLKILP
jgi:hypothetical protein